MKTNSLLQSIKQAIFELPDEQLVSRDILFYAIERALRSASQHCQDCGKPTSEGHIHTCSPQVADEREAFELTAKFAWEGWKARASLPPQAVEPAPIHQWRKRIPKGEPWHDAGKREAYARVDDYYEARTVYAAPPSPQTKQEALRKLTEQAEELGLYEVKTERDDPLGRAILFSQSARDVALEEAAKVCERSYSRDHAAANIRALKKGGAMQKGEDK